MGTLVINQPYYFPQLHWWNRAVNADVLVYLDDVHHNTNYPLNRALVHDGNKEQYLTIPLPKKHRRDKANEIIISSRDWISDHKRKLNSYYKPGYDILDIINSCNYDVLSEIAIQSIEEIENRYSIGLPKRIKSSSLNLSSTKNDRLIDICRYTNSNTLILGLGSKNYVMPEIDKYKDNGIIVKYQDWKCPVANYSILHSLIKDGCLTKKVLGII